MPQKKLKRVSKKKSASPWEQAPSIREGILTQVKQNRSVVVVDPQNRRGFVIDGVAADLWLMLERAALRLRSEGR